MNKYLNVTQLSDYLGIKPKTLYAWVSEKRIPHKKIGRLVRFELGEVDEWMSSHNVNVYKPG